MTKIEIFDDVTKVMGEDTAFCRDKPDHYAKKYREKIANDMSEKEFLFWMKAYLGNFKVPGHLAFVSVKDRGILPFEVRCYQGILYVVEAQEAVGVKKGEKILEIEHRKIEEIEEKYGEFFYGESEERQGRHWKALLQFFTEMTVEGLDGTRRSEPITLQELETTKEREHYEYRQLDEAVAYLRLDDFMEEEKLNDFLAVHDSEITGSKHLIIDVRENGGGVYTAIAGLLKYCLDKGRKLSDYPDEEEDTINYTKRNVELRLAMLKEYRKQKLPEETKKMLGLLEDEMRANAGKGFCKLPKEDMDFCEVGAACPEKVIILSDCYCGSVGDIFVQTMKKSEKVTVLGRPTMGIMDYADVATISYGDYRLIYPTSRSGAIDAGQGMSQRGVSVEQYIPWTPEHLLRDVDLETAWRELRKPEA